MRGWMVLGVVLWTAVASAGPRDDPARTLVPRIDLEGVALATALNRLSLRTGVALQADWPGLAEAGVTPESPVRLRAQSLPLGQALGLLLASLEGRPAVAWSVEGPAIRIVPAPREPTTQATQPAPRPEMRLRVLPMPARPEAPPAPRPIVRGYDFQATPLAEVVEFFRATTDVNFFVNWRALEAIGIDRSTPITLQVQDVRPAQAMDLVLEQLNPGQPLRQRVFWVLEQGVVTISSGEALDQQTRTVVLDVGDLLIVAPNRPGPTLRIDSAGKGRGPGDIVELDGREEDEPSVAQRRTALEQTLVDSILDATGPEIWRPIGKGTIRLVGGRLIIEQTRLGFKLLEPVLGR